ncbi:hypothetical protein DYB32_001437 [Aphanomyces invadans]|uniref:Uncharacterized protein n=1 Tax=Aphanomyces invadans TaxID=157072 RepID=A0A418B6J0_9STRA|nr:hypothetical protein DYB32_001437 [Aphanomyces invadans]
MEKPTEATAARRDEKTRDSHSHGEKKRSREDEKKLNDMERRKIQKYKEDKLKERKDHTRRVLEQQAQEKRRDLLGRQSEFIGTLEFRNQLPDLPFDAKFIQYAHDPDRFVKYKPSLIERDYVHEFYVEPNLGLPIDLIDPEKFEVPDVSERAMTNVDIELLNMPEVISGSSAAKAKIRPHSYDILPSSETKHDPAIFDRESHALLRNVVTVSQPNASDVLLGSILFPSNGNKALEESKTNDSGDDGAGEKFKFFRDYVLSINHVCQPDHALLPLCLNRSGIVSE